MIKTSITLAAIVALTACAQSRPAQPQAAQPEITGPRMVERMQPPPVHALLGYREELELTSEQIGAIDSIGQWLFTSGDTIRTRLRDVQGTARDRRDARATQETIQAITGLSERNRQASDGVQEVLTDEQEARVCELFGDERQRTAVRPRQARQTRRTGALPDAGIPPVWRWCGLPDEGETASNGS